MLRRATFFTGVGQVPDDVLEALTQSVDRFGRERIDAMAIDRDHRIPKELLRGLAELGLFGLSVPESYGGAGLSLAGVCTVVAALARWDRSVATTLGLHLGLGLRPLVAFGSAAQKARYLPALACGEKIAAFATTESAAGSDLSGIRTTASLEGDDLLVRGDKIYVTNGGLASVFTITASTPSLGGARRGHSLVLLEREDRGLEVGAEERKLGLRGSSTVPLFFDGVRVPAERLLGEPGQGMAHLEHILAWGRTAMAAGCTGAARAAILRAAAHVTTRVQFGRPLAEFAVVKAQVAEMAATCFAMEAMVSAVCEAEDDPARLLRRSLSAKVFASEGGWALSDLAVQLHGGSGFIEDTDLPMLLRDARITRIFEGANDVLLVHLGTLEATTPASGADTSATPSATATSRAALSAAASSAALSSSPSSAWTPASAGASSSPAATSLADPRGDANPGRDAAEIVDRVHERSADLRKRYGIRLLRQQRVLHHLGRLAVWRDAAVAAASRAARDGSDMAAMLAAQGVARARAEVLASLEPRSLRALEGDPAERGADPEKIAHALYAEVSG